MEKSEKPETIESLKMNAINMQKEPHLHVDLTTLDVNIAKKICADCVCRSIITEVENKEKAITE